jgi:hypothetical protein
MGVEGRLFYPLVYNLPEEIFGSGALGNVTLDGTGLGATGTPFYANDIGSNLEWTNDLRYSNCNFNTNIEPYLKDRPWWASNSDNLNSSWNLWGGKMKRYFISVDLNSAGIEAESEY